MRLSQFVIAFVASVAFMPGSSRGDFGLTCPGCETVSSSAYTTVECSSGETAFIRVAVSGGDGRCKKINAAPYFVVCVPQTNCRPFFSGEKGIVGGATATHAEFVDVDCGSVASTVVTGLCGLSVQVIMPCTSCEE